MLAGRGKYLLMLDADGATEISDLGRLLDKMKKIERDGHGMVVGSRAHLVANVVAKVYSFIFYEISEILYFRTIIVFICLHKITFYSGHLCVTS